MTVKRDLKRRVRQRQARTGEAYVTARRHVVAARPDASDPGNLDPGDADLRGAGADNTSTDSAAAAPDPAAAMTLGATATAGPDAAAGAVPGTATAATDASATTMPDTAGAAPDTAAPTTAVPVVELLDVTDQARRAGLACRVMMFPSLAERVEPARVLRQLRDLLIETADDPQMLLLAQLGLAGHAPGLPTRPTILFESLRRFLRRALSGLGGAFEDGSMFAFHIAGEGGIVPIQCALDWRGAALMLSAIDDLIGDGHALKDQIIAEWLDPHAPARQINYLASRLAPRMPSGPTLFVFHDGRRYAITRDEFLIGRNSRDAHLAIKDGLVSRHHAAVIRRNGAYYLKDLGSTHGVHYKGMRIDNKRIEEGDVFQLGDHELRFTFQDEK